MIANAATEAKAAVGRYRWNHSVDCNYDENQLIMDIAEGRLMFSEIAAKHGIDASYVGKIACGRRRPELMAPIEAAAVMIRRQNRRLGSHLTRVAWSRLGKLTAAPKDVADETQRRAAVDIIKLDAADAPTPKAAKPPAGPDLTDLSEPTKSKVLTELGGPTD